ncbi:uncharacterized protein LOC116614327 [Nematostella vectensis]|uniref:uncharacterized protein LOC116614327 n=1 Tax=Nematostella vectensis TaxID=45351 RepID=UPI0013906D07|nr:uncharacterized protein LOC116614327 [Nematostella vectensis]
MAFVRSNVLCIAIIWCFGSFYFSGAALEPTQITSVVAISTTSLRVEWEPYKNTTGIIGYVVFFDDGSMTYQNITVMGSVSTAAVIDGLTMEVPYCIKMSSITRDGVSENWDGRDCVWGTPMQVTTTASTKGMSSSKQSANTSTAMSAVRTAPDISCPQTQESSTSGASKHFPQCVSLFLAALVFILP